MIKTVEEIFECLKKPFKPEDIEWRIGRKSKDRTKATVLAYMTARAVEERLDEAVGPENWEVYYSPIDMGTITDTVVRWSNGQQVEKQETKALKGFLCNITIKYIDEDGEIHWITRSDGSNCTDFEPIKGGLSGALKRAASQFGIGRYLYNLKETWVPIDQYGNFKPPTLPAWALPDGYEPKAEVPAGDWSTQDIVDTPSNEDWNDVPPSIPMDEGPVSDEPVMKSGKYAGRKVSEIEDKGYLAWIVEKSKCAPEIKYAAQKALTA